MTTKVRNRNLLAIVDSGDVRRLRIRSVETEKRKLRRSRSRRRAAERKEQAE
jgi:hypothetical protein